MSRDLRSTAIAVTLGALGTLGTLATVIAAEPVLAAPAANSAFCTAQLTTTATVASLDALSPSQASAALKKLAATVRGVTAPASVSTSWSILSKALDAAANGKPEALYDDALSAPLQTIAVHVADSCGYKRIVVTSTENRYAGLPATLPSGVTSFKHVNKGKDAHVVLVFRRRTGVTRSAAAVLKDMAAAATQGKDPYPTLQQSYESVSDFSSYAKPGETSAVTITLTPGTYLALDSLPVGYNGTGAEPKGPLHADKGMFAEFTVR